jgi:hypothetical protein
VVILFVVLWWVEPEVENIVAIEISVNKATFVASDLVDVNFLRLLSLRHGGEASCKFGMKAAELELDCEAKKGSKASSCGVHQRR